MMTFVEFVGTFSKAVFGKDIFQYRFKEAKICASKFRISLLILVFKAQHRLWEGNNSVMYFISSCIAVVVCFQAQIRYFTIFFYATSVFVSILSAIGISLFILPPDKLVHQYQKCARSDANET